MKSKTFSRLTAMLIVVMLVLSMCVTGISAAAAAVSDGTKVVYLKPNSNWEVDNARFAVYMFEGSNSQWVDMEDDDADGYYAATLPEGNWDKIIFCRMSPSAAENNWNNKWNQTADLDIPDGMNCYTVKDGTWDKGGGEWSYYTPQGATEPTEPTEPTSPATEDEPTTAPLATDYYLFGFINGANYACEEDYENIGEYKFVDGQLTATFETASYVGVKTGDNANWYMTDGWAGIVTEVTLYNTSELGVDANKLMVPAGEVTFTLVDNGDGTLTLSYKAETLPTIPEPETTVEPTEETEPTEEPTEAPVTTEYYLFGYINETNYGCEEDYENIGEYKFVDGQLTATFETASYVGVKTGDNANWYMTDGWAGIVTEVTLYNTSELGVNADKLMVPAGEVTFTLVDNGDGTLTLSYEAETLPTIPEPETTVEPTEVTDPTEVTEPTSPATEDEPTTAPSMTEYYLFGFINGANYACEEDYENIGEYKFVDGQLTATFETASYVGVKTGDNANWYMTDGWAGIVTEVTLYNTSELGVNADKLMVPAGEVTFTLVDNGDGTLTLSYEAETLPTIPEPETTVEPTEETEPTEVTEPTSPATEDEPTTAPSMTEYYLFGFINGANYACEEDYENIGEYKFVDGQLTATFETASYVGVKTGDNANWYMTDGWAGIVTEVTLYNTSELGVNADKLMVPAGEVTFTLVDNGDGTLTLSYEAETLPTIPEPETTVEPTEETDPTEATEPVTDKLIVNAKSNIFPSVTETFDKDEETVTVSYKLSSNMRAVNTQWVLTYDNTKLQYDSADNMSNGEQTICPSAGNDLIFNHEDNCIKGTFSKLNLISFEEGADLVSVTFKVIGTGVADVYLDLEFFTLAYVDGDGIVQDASIVDYGEMQDISGIAGFENAEISTSTVIEGNIMMGDINDDGMISVIDVTMILKYSVGTQSLTASQMKAADVDKDGIVNVKDATMIQKYIAEMIDEL